MRQVVEQEPTPPSRWNAAVPRNLEVICLKCLRKEPHRRYSSAAALAADLRRFERAEPITARPSGPLERSVRWLGRRRVHVAALALGTLLGVALVGGGLWLRSEHDASIRRERARARREQALMARLDAIHLNRATLVEGRFNAVAERRFNNSRADRNYESAFREARFGAIGDNPAHVAARIAASASRPPLLAALADWAICAADESRRAWVLGVAQKADPDAWHDRARAPAAWADRTALAQLAGTAPVANQPAPFLVAIGERLHDLGGDGTTFLARVHHAHPDDFWAALTLARALQEGGDHNGADAAYQRALELRRGLVAVYNDRGLIAFAKKDWPAAYDDYEKALQIDRHFAPAHNNLGLALKGEGKWPEAVQHLREAVRLDPELAPAHYNLAEIRAYQGGLDEAIDHYRQALRIDPEFARAEYMFGVALAGSGRMDAAIDRYRRALRIDPADAKAHERTFGRAQAWGIILYKLALSIDPKFTPSHNNLGLTPSRVDRLNEAIGHYETALRIEPGLLAADAALGQALLALGRFRDALAATRRCLDQLPQGHELHANVLAQLRRCERLIALQDRLPAVLQGKDKPVDVSETVEFAELCGILGRTVSVARLFADALAASPQMAGELRSDLRYRTACATALAGCGRGDAANLSQAERARWREQARDLLRAEVTLWAGVLDHGAAPDRIEVWDQLTHLWTDPDLAGLLDQESLEELPPSERQEHRALWGEIDALIRRAQTIE